MKVKTKAIIVSLLFLFSCNNIVDCVNIQEGIVVDKKYEKENNINIMTPINVGNIRMFQHTILYDDEDFILTVKSELKGKKICKKVYVSKNLYENINIGDKWMKNKDCSFLDND